MKISTKLPLVLFNASVILAGLASPKGGSAKLINFIKQSRIRGVISEIIMNEVERRAEKVGLTPGFAKQTTLRIFKFILPPPKKSITDYFSNIVIDPGDTHVLASAKEAQVNYLVSLDKKHVLSLKKSIKKINICSPKELIENLAKNRTRKKNQREKMRIRSLSVTKITRKSNIAMPI